MLRNFICALFKKRIYAVTEGDCSYYHIVAVFDKKELAQECIETWQGMHLDKLDIRIEEYKLNPEILMLKEGETVYEVSMTREGDTKYVCHCDPILFPFKNVDYFWSDDTGFLTKVIAKSKEHAVKITNEIRTQLIAENRWGKNEYV